MRGSVGRFSLGAGCEFRSQNLGTDLTFHHLIQFIGRFDHLRLDFMMLCVDVGRVTKYHEERDAKHYELE